MISDCTVSVQCVHTPSPAGETAEQSKVVKRLQIDEQNLLENVI